MSIVYFELNCVRKKIIFITLIPFQCILPFRLFLLCKNDAGMKRLIEQLMDHGESKKQFAEFWNKIEKKWEKLLNNNSDFQVKILYLKKNTI